MEIQSAENYADNHVVDVAHMEIYPSQAKVIGPRDDYYDLPRRQRRSRNGRGKPYQGPSCGGTKFSITLEGGGR